MLKLWKTLRSRIIFNNPWYVLRQDTVELPNGKIVDDYFVSVRHDVALVFPLTKDQNTILVKQYKHGLGEIVLELPGGFFDVEEEKAEKAAERELLEETGYAPGQLIKLGTLSDNPTKDTNRLHLFLAKDCTRTGEQHLDDLEDIEIIPVPVKDLKGMIEKGLIKVSGSVAGIFMALEYLNKSENK